MDLGSRLRQRLRLFCIVMTVATGAFLWKAPVFFGIAEGSDHPSWDSDSRFYDIMFRLRSSLGLEGPASPDIVHVDIDDATLEQMRTRWPIPRVDQAKGFQSLYRLGVSHMVIDIEYLDQAEWHINRDALLDFSDYIEESFPRLRKVVGESEAPMERKFEVDSLHRDMRSLYAQFARDPDALLTDVLAAAGTTIALHSETEKIRKVPADSLARFSADPLWIETEAVSGADYLEAASDRRVWMIGECESLNLERTFWGEGGAVEEILSRWPAIDSDVGESLLLEWEPLYNQARAIHIAVKYNSIEGGKSDKLLYPAHASLMERWAHGEVGFGFVDANSEPDGYVRRVPLFEDVRGRRIFQMALRGHLAESGVDLASLKFEKDALVVGDVRIPLEYGRWFRVNWVDRKEDRKRTTVSFKDLWEMADLELFIHQNYEMGLGIELGPTEVALAVEKGHFDLPFPELEPIVRERYESATDPDVRRTYLECLNQIREWIRLKEKLEPLVRGKLAFVGMAANSSTDRRPTPLDPDLDMVDLHATVADNIRQGQFIRVLGSGWQASIGLVVMGLLSVLFNRFGFVGGFLTWLSTLLLVLLVGFGLFLADGWLLRGVTLSVAASLLFLGVSGTKQLIEVYQKSFFKNTLGQFLSPNVADFISKNPEALYEMNQGKRQRMTVLFADIRGFTPFCEPLSPTEVQTAVNRIMNALTPAVFEFDGTHDKYMGDCIMAFFGAPMSYEEHALQACRCALKMRRILDDLVEEMKAEGMRPLDMGIGISTGEMTVGNFGSSDTSDYSVLGDAVNLGARIEGLTRPLEADILITDETFKDVKDYIEYRDRGRHEVKGKSEPVQIWELLGFRDDDADKPAISDEDLVRRLQGG